MSEVELTLSQLNALFESGTVAIQTNASYPLGDNTFPKKVAELANEKIVPAAPNGGCNQRFKFEKIPGTFKYKISLMLEDGTKVYVTSEKATHGSYLTVSKEGTVYTVGWTPAGHSISAKGKNGVELYWTFLPGDFPGPQIVLQNWEGFMKLTQGWKFIRN